APYRQQYVSWLEPRSPIRRLDLWRCPQQLVHIDAAVVIVANLDHRDASRRVWPGHQDAVTNGRIPCNKRVELYHRCHNCSSCRVRSSAACVFESSASILAISPFTTSRSMGASSSNVSTYSGMLRLYSFSLSSSGVARCEYFGTSTRARQVATIFA